MGGCWRTSPSVVHEPRSEQLSVSGGRDGCVGWMVAFRGRVGLLRGATVLSNTHLCVGVCWIGLSHRRTCVEDPAESRTQTFLTDSCRTGTPQSRDSRYVASGVGGGWPAV